MPKNAAHINAPKTKKVRIPLDHPQCEAIGKRVALLIVSDVLNTSERGLLIKLERQLREVDHRLARQLIDRPLPQVAIRPRYWEESFCPASPFFGWPVIEVWTGWVLRLDEYIVRLESKYFSASREDCADEI